MTEHITKRDNKRFIHQDKDDFMKFSNLVEAHQAISASAACRQEAALKLALKKLQQTEEIKTRDRILIELQKLSRDTSEPAIMASKYLIKNDPGHASIDILNLKARPYHCLRNRNINTQLVGLEFVTSAKFPSRKSSRPCKASVMPISTSHINSESSQSRGLFFFLKNAN